MDISPISLSSLFEYDTTGGLVCRKELKNSFIGYVVNISHTQIDKICELVIECQSKLLIKNLQETNNCGISQGFIIYEWSIDSLKKSLSSSTVLICIIDHEKNKVAGYLLLTSVNNLIHHVNSEFGQLEFDQNLITDEQWKQFTSTAHVHYIEQIGVATEFGRLGIGSSLIELAKGQSSEGICALVSFRPYHNFASANLLTKNGFQSVGILTGHASTKFAPSKSIFFICTPVKAAL